MYSCKLYTELAKTTIIVGLREFCLCLAKYVFSAMIVSDEISVEPLTSWLGLLYLCRLLSLLRLLLSLILSRPLSNLKQKKVVRTSHGVISLAKYELIQNWDQIASKMGLLAENAGQTSMSHYEPIYLYNQDYG